MAGSLNYNAMPVSCGRVPCSGVPFHEAGDAFPMCLVAQACSMNPKLGGTPGFGCECIGVDSSHAVPAGPAPFVV